MANPNSVGSHSVGLSAGPGAEFRRRAEDRCEREVSPPQGNRQALSPQESLQVHELRVHQIELEMQNDELRRTQIELDTARARYFDLYDLAPVGYCSVTPQGLLKEANLYVATLLGVSRSRLVKQSMSKIIYRGDQDIYYRCRKQLLENNQAQSCELRMVKSDDTLVWVALTIIGAQSPDGTTVLRMVIGDISERKAMDASLQEKNLELDQARIAADRANLAKSDFLSSMSHELRTPLNAILGFAQLMEIGTPAPTEAQASSIRQILRAGWYLLSLVDEILDLAMIESGKLVLTMESTSLTDVLLDCQALIEPQAQQIGIRVTFTQFGCPLHGPCPCMVNADPTRVKQVVLNLLSNAIKYNAAGGSVEVSCGPAGPRRVRIQVRDTGAGLSPQQLTQLFQPFNRLGQEATATKGTGIGLVVSQRLVKAMGGEMGVQSTVGKGSVFWFDLNQSDELLHGTGPAELT